MTHETAHGTKMMRMSKTSHLLNGGTYSPFGSKNAFTNFVAPSVSNP